MLKTPGDSTSGPQSSSGFRTGGYTGIGMERRSTTRCDLESGPRPSFTCMRVTGLFETRESGPEVTGVFP